MKLRPVKPRVLLRLLKKLGFNLARVHGSHHVFEKNGKILVVPVHKGEEIGVGLLRKIIRDLGLNVEEFLEMLE